MDDQHLAAVARDGKDSVFVERCQRSQVEHAGFDTVAGELLGDTHRDVHVCAIRDDCQVVSGAAQRRLANRYRLRCLLRQHLLDPRIAVERDVLEVENGIRVGDSRRHQRTRVLRRRWHHDFQSGRAVEPRFGVLAMVWTRVAQASPRHPEDHRNRRAPPVALLCRVVDDLIEPGRGKVVELRLGDRTLSRERGTDRDSEDGVLGNRRIDDAIAELLQQRPEQQKRAAIQPADVLAVDEYPRVGAQRIRNARRDRFEQRHALAIERHTWIQLRQSGIQIGLQPP